MPPRQAPGIKPKWNSSPGWIAKGLLLAALLAPPSGGVLAYEKLVAARVVPTPVMRVPEYLRPTTDPVFGTPFVRVTDPGRQILTGVSCRPDYCRHRYSSAQAWNADQTLLVIANGCPGLCFLDGQTYQPAFQRSVDDECEWHPTDPALMICVSETEIYGWAVRSDARTTIFAPKEHRQLRFGPGKGNLSKDGSRLVVRAMNSAGEPVAFAYDIEAVRKYPDIALSNLAGRNSYCSIAPSGRHIFASR